MLKYKARCTSTIIWYMMYDRETGKLLADEGVYNTWISHRSSHVEKVVTRTLSDQKQHGDIFSSLVIGDITL